MVTGNPAGALCLHYIARLTVEEGADVGSNLVDQRLPGIDAGPGDVWRDQQVRD